MMTGKELMEYATVREHFRTLRNYIDFALAYIEFAERGLQARIVCQNETNYQFFQYREDCTYNISRPVNADSISVPVPDEDGHELFRMNYQHDLVVRGSDGDIRLLGSVKTSSKDRIDKIFVDKMLFSRLTGRETPYIAVFLNDVRRAKTTAPGRYQVNSTFLTGHFKAYSIRLAPLDGVFYCDLRPAMRTDPFLADRIKTIDSLFFDELASRELLAPKRRRQGACTMRPDRIKASSRRALAD